MAIKETTFSYNWNGKLNNGCFTTLRLHNPRKYGVGEIHGIVLRSKKTVTIFGDAVIVDVKQIYGRDINEFIAHLDTGYSVEETKKILKRMYKSDVESMAFSLVLYKYLPNN